MNNQPALSLATEATTTGLSNREITVALGALGVALASLIFVVLQLNRQYVNSREMKDGKTRGLRQVDATFARMTGLVSVAVLGLAGLCLGIVIDTEVVAAFYTLLGTIAGYLVSAKTTSTQTTQRETDTQGNVTETQEAGPQLLL